MSLNLVDNSLVEDCADVMLENDSPARNYQLELFHAAVNENTIVYLQTGSGKTFIAALLIREKASEITKPLSQGGRRSVFLVPTVILAVQQANYLRRHTSLKVGEYYGSNTVDLWTGEKWEEEFKTHHVLTMTAQKFLNLLNHGFVSINQVNLLIIDECHSAVKDAPMKQIMKFISQSARDGPVPRILGLTAALFRKKCKPSAVNAVVKELESTMNARVRTASDIQSSLRNSTKPTELVCQCLRQRQDLLPEQVRLLLVRIREIIEQKLIKLGGLEADSAGDHVRESVEILREINFLTENFGPFAADHAALLCSKKIKSLTVTSAAAPQDVKNHLQLVGNAVGEIRALYKEVFLTYKGSKDLIYDLTTPRVHKLFEILRKFQPRPRTSPEEDQLTLCGIIFVERRSSANVLFHLLKAVSLRDESLSFIKPLFTMGQSTGSSKEKIKESQCLRNKQKEIMRKFRDGVCNLLVSTSVLEEGVDVPSCNLVIRFDGVKTYCDYVQSKGRARSPNAFYIVMATEDEEESWASKTHVLLDSLAQFHAIEQMLLQSSKSNYKEDKDQDQLWADIVPAYCPKPNGPRVTLLSALPLVNRYCATLPSEPTSVLVPEWKVNEIFRLKDVDSRYLSYLSGKEPDPSMHYFQCKLTLPLNSPLREEMVGPVMPSKRLAKRVVALEACAKLHQIGELDDEHLLPKKKRSTGENEGETVGSLRPSAAQFYIKGIPKILKNCPPQPGKSCYLHLLRYQVIGHLNQDQTFDPESTRWRIGFITSHRMPKLNPFRIFTRIGLVSVCFEEIDDQLVLDQRSMELCRKFQSYFCQEVLNVEANDIRFDPESATLGYLIVPVGLSDMRIDLDLIEKVFQSPVNRNNLKTLGFELIDLSSFEVEMFQDAMVMSCHKASDSFYYVDAVSSLTPESPFPNEAYRSFSEFYDKRHNCKIRNTSQRLLRVSKESEQRNALMPKYVSRKNVNTKAGIPSTKAIQSDKENASIHFVPELCVVHPYPASLWRQTVWIPPIFHRLEKLLLANELREDLASRMNLNQSDSTLNTSWELIQLSGSSYHPNRLASSGLAKSHVQSYSIVQIGPEINVNDGVAEAVETVGIDRKDETLKSIEELEDISIWNINLHELKQDDEEVKGPEKVVESGGVETEDTFIHLMDGITLDSRDSEDSSMLSAVQSQLEENRWGTSMSFDENQVCFDPRGPSPGHILQAMTLAVTNEAFNLERLETVGDSFLKLATSIHLYCNSSSNLHEGLLSELRSKRISNQNLHRLGKSIGLPHLMAAVKLVPSENWLPPGYVAVDSVEQEQQHNPRVWQKIADKSVADAVEALIGTYLTTTGIAGALKFMKCLEMEVPEPGQGSSCFGGVVPSPLLCQPTDTDQILDDLLSSYESFEERINYKFRNRCYLLQAFSHASYYPNRLTGCYQRLEFLGDAVFDYLITRFLYEEPQQYSPGALSDLRSALVNNSTFAVLAVRHGFHCYLKHMIMDLDHILDKFIQRQEENHHKVLDDYFLFGDGDDRMASNVEVPKVLGDIFESVAGAIFLDSNLSLDAVWNVFYPLLGPELESFSRNIPISPIRKLHEAEPGRVKFKKIKEKLEDGRVCVVAEVEGRGSFKGVGHNLRIAKCTAAKYALRELETLPLEH